MTSFEPKELGFIALFIVTVLVLYEIAGPKFTLSTLLVLLISVIYSKWDQVNSTVRRYLP